MKLTARLKQWLIQNWSIKAGSDDATFRKAAGEAMVAGEDDGGLSLEMLTTLTTTKSTEEADEFTTMVKGLSTAIEELSEIITDEKSSEDSEEETEDDEPAPRGKKTADDNMPAKRMPKTQEVNQGKEEDEAGEGDVDSVSEGKKKSTKGGNKTAPSAFEKMITRASNGSSASYDDDEPDGTKGGVMVRVKRAVEQYSSTKTAMIAPPTTAKGRSHPMAGRQLMDYSESGRGRALDVPSDRDKAVAGAWSKFVISASMKKSKNLAFMSLPEHDRDLVVWALENEKWGGATDGGNTADIDGRKLRPHEQKSLIDDSTSGGTDAAPILFDDMVIQTPLLNGELFPYVNTIPIDRGRRIEGVVTGTVTGGWGGVDDTSIALYDTTSYITAFDTTIFRWEGSIRIGLDFLSDTPIDFGQHLTAQYGERLLEDLDDVIASGNGTTQPEGISVKAGTTSINFGASTTLGNYEALRFGVRKPEHRSALMSSAVFCGSETSYQRARAIPVGASDARRLGGTFGVTLGGTSGYDGYNWMDRPFKINESMGNTTIFYAILARYRMYRRRGLTMRTSTEGDTLIRKNEMLMVAMCRMGGQLERGAVAAVTTTAPA